MKEMALPERDSYWRPWLLTFALVAAGWLLYGRLTRPATITPFPKAPLDLGVNHYFILRMPPITSQYESGIETMRLRYGAWLEALTAAGYRPLLFSELYRLTADQAGVPPKSVVLMFDPGFRRTYHIVSPILERHRWSAVWMSDLAAMKARHREHISFHTARRMVRSGLWDVGLKKTDGTYRFDIGQEENFNLGNRTHGTWAAISGGLGLNQTGALFALNCLNVNSDWLPTDLVNRLNAELPVEGPVYFSLGGVQNLTWGLTQKEPATFNLAAEPQQRSAIVSWLGTKGLDNAKFRLKGKGLAGTLSLRLRWDEISGSGLQISVAHNKLVVQEWKNGESRLVYKVSRPMEPNFRVLAMLVGDRLALSMDGGATAAIPTPLWPGSGKGVTQVYLQDGVMGAARVRDIEIFFEPLPQAAVLFSAAMEPL